MQAHPPTSVSIVQVGRCMRLDDPIWDALDYFKGRELCHDIIDTIFEDLCIYFYMFRVHLSHVITIETNWPIINNVHSACSSFVVHNVYVIFTIINKAQSYSWSGHIRPLFHRPWLVCNLQLHVLEALIVYRHAYA